MNFKKFLAVAAVGALAVSTMAFAVSAKTIDEPEGVSWTQITVTPGGGNWTPVSIADIPAGSQYIKFEWDAANYSGAQIGFFEAANFDAINADNSYADAYDGTAINLGNAGAYGDSTGGKAVYELPANADGVWYKQGSDADSKHFTIYVDAQAAGATEAPATEAPAAGSTTIASAGDKGGADTGVAGVAAIAGMAIIATVAVVASRKKK